MTPFPFHLLFQYNMAAVFLSIPVKEKWDAEGVVPYDKNDFIIVGAAICRPLIVVCFRRAADSRPYIWILLKAAPCRASFYFSL